MTREELIDEVDFILGRVFEVHENAPQYAIADLVHAEELLENVKLRIRKDLETSRG